MTARFYPSICRLMLILASFDVAAWIYPEFLLTAVLVSVILQEAFWMLLSNRAPKKLLFVGFVLAEGLALFLLREREVFDSLLFAGIAFPCARLLYPGNMPELLPERSVPSGPEKKDLLRLSLPGTLLALLIFRFLTGEVGKLSVLPLLFLLLLEGARVCYGRFAIRLSGILMILTLFLALLPTPEKPLDWSFLERMARAVEDRIQTIRMDFDYYTQGFAGGEGTTGYSGLGRVTDSVGTENRTELKLTDSNVSGQLYLAGATFYRYEKDHWTDKEEGDPRSWITDYLQALRQQEVTPEEAACFSEWQGEGITYAYLRTKDRMLPLTTISVTDFSERRGREVFQKGDSYTIQYLDVDFGSPYLQDIIRNAASHPKEECSLPELHSYGKELYHTGFALAEETGEDVLSAALDQSGVTEGMRSLSDEITKDAATPYDKALAIEQYLRRFRYRRETDLGGDLNRFLFESREGYCVHFATSMVLLLRAQGIPARYCEGYLCRFNEKDEEGHFIVSSVDGHAWAEAYMEGFGWVPMEPTPVIAVSAVESGWNRTLSPEEESSSEKQMTPVPVSEAVTEDIAEENGTEAKESGYLTVLLAVIAFLAGFLLLTICIRFLIRRILYGRLSNREKAVEEFRALRRKYLRISGEKNENLPMRETLKGVAALLRERDERASFGREETPSPGRNPESMLTFWYEVRYGDRNDVDPAAIKDLARIRRLLRRPNRSTVSSGS